MKEVIFFRKWPFSVKTTEVRRVHVHSSLLDVTSNQNASNKKKIRLNIYPKPGMSNYIAE